MKQTSICFVVVYFGKWPSYMDYFLKSCLTNPSVHIKFFTNNETLNYTGDNIELIPFSKEEFNALASEKLQLKVAVADSYKLCDFKPIYGKLFESYLTAYDFWGFCDIDVVFGNIRKFITEEMLNTYDVISARKEYICGHFSLFKNEERINQLFRESADYEKIVTEPSYCYSFDECGRLWWELLGGQSIWDVETPIDSFTHVVRRLERKGSLKCYFETIVTEPDKMRSKNLDMEKYREELLWNRGTLTAPKTKKEFLHFHSNTLKHWKHFIVPRGSKIPDKFYITDRGFTISPWRKIMKSLTLYTPFGP